MDNQKWFEIALRAIEEKIPPGGEFELNELFGDDWLREPFGVRTEFGKFFSKAVERGEVPNAEKADTGRNNHRFYRKKC